MADLRVEECLKTPNKKKKLNKKIFSRIAKHYDLINIFLSFGRDRALKKKLVKNINKNPKDTFSCLDLACGTGDLCFFLCNLYPKVSVHGIDITQEMLDVAEKRKKGKFPSLTFQCGDMLEASNTLKSVDVITGGYALRNTSDLDKTLSLIYDLLAENGEAHFLDFSQWNNDFLAKIQYLVLKCWCQFWGFVLYGNKDLYGYISKSLRVFPNQKNLRKKILNYGFSNYRIKRHLFGMLATSSFVKPQK